MKFSSMRYILLEFALCLSCGPKTEQQSQPTSEKAITFKENPSEKKIDVLIDDKLFTAYRWPDSVYKPILYPIVSAEGNTVTRGFPLEAREGERNDHRHQVGNWLNYGNVNGYDFWGNGHSGEKSPNGGQIQHSTIESRSGGSDEGKMITSASWLDPDGNELLKEKTEFYFIARGPVRIIDRITTLTSSAQTDVTFKDTKEGMLAIRVARQLELPSDQEIVLTDASGQARSAKDKSNAGVTGNYRSSEGITGEAVWGTRARWMNLYGTIGNEQVSVIVFDHPENISYLTWWHARGYGLLSANPLGAKDFTQGKQELNFSLQPCKAITFRYRIVIASGSHLPDHAVNELASEFANKY